MSEYDVIVVGAGSAGAVVASRASEDPSRRVLLLDAGPDYPELADTPRDLKDGNNNSYVDHDWGLSYVPTNAGRESPFPRGRVTGGSSAVNTCIALRGMPEDYDGWAAAGNTEWSWEKVLPAFRRLERDLDFGGERWHGDAGPITIRRYPWEELQPTQQAFIEAARELGFPDCPDANDPDSWGAGPHPMNKVGRIRVSTAVGYLAPARIRPNLEIRGHCHARRVVIEDGRATGVEFERDGEVQTVSGRLVVLSAGAIMTPPLLLRSGLGPRDDVGRIGVELVREVPGVGRNLSDHPALSVYCASSDPSVNDTDAPFIQTILRYTAPGSGSRNDLQIEPFSFGGLRGAPPGGFPIAAVLEQAHSRGRLIVESADPLAKPRIEPCFLDDERDLERLAACFRDVLAFTRTKAYAGLIDRVLFPDPERELTDDVLNDLLRRLAASGYHPCGTAKMGPSSDPDAVVDQYGMCHAVGGLAVADASIMPEVPRANTNLSSIMIGEQIGEWIRNTGERYGL